MEINSFLTFQNFRDVSSQVFNYEPIACIEFRGTVTSTGQSSGHYICDVKPKFSNEWYRTDDTKTFKLKDENNVTNLSYVTLYRKK